MDWLPCLYAAGLIAVGMASAALVGYWAGRAREQRALLDILIPEKWSTPAH